MNAKRIGSDLFVGDFIPQTRHRLLHCAAELDSPAAALQVKSAVADPMFPVAFLLRNLMTLELEPRWQRLTVSARRSGLLTMLIERSSIFCEVRDWLRLRGAMQEPAAGRLQQAAQHGVSTDYCTHCGGCCEIAGGLAIFPEGVDIPATWRRIFADGLGPNHRFCAFLWEAGGHGLSLCAIHHWRPNPCRLFALDECRHLMSDPGFAPFLDHSQLAAVSSRLCRLLDGGQLPP